LRSYSNALWGSTFTLLKFLWALPIMMANSSWLAQATIEQNMLIQ